MAVTIRGVVADDGNNATTQPTVTLPAGTVSTDLIVLYESSESATADELPSPTNGPWTQRAFSGTTGTALPQSKVWTRSGLTAGAVITSTQTEATDTHYLCAYVLVGADTSGFLASASSTGTGSTTHTAPTLSPTKSGLYIGLFTANGTDYSGVGGGLTQDAKRTVAGDNAFIAGSKQVAAGSVNGSGTYSNSTDTWSGASFFVGASGPTEIAGSDTVTFALTDSASVDLKTKADSDTVTFALTDSATVSVPIQIAGSDTVTFALTDAMTVLDRYTIKTASDTVTFALADDAVRQGLGPTSGTWISPPLALPEDPIAGAILFWDATVGPGATLVVETSVDNGASWQLATNRGPVDRLPIGSSTAKALLTRVTMTRLDANDPTPRLHRMELRVAIDSSVDEMVPLGYFMLTDAEVVDSVAQGLSVRLSGVDVSYRVARNTWDETLVIAEGTNFNTAIETVISNRYPAARFNLASTERTTPRLFFGEQGGRNGGDPWSGAQGQGAQGLARDIGFQLFPDAYGVFTSRAEPDPDVMPSVFVFEDSMRPTITDLSRSMTNRDTYNQVVVYGETPTNSAPVTARWQDLDATSRTFFDGPYGKVTKTIVSDKIASVEQAQDVADAEGRKVKGATEIVRITALCAPFLEIGDVIEVDRSRSKTSGRFAIDAWSIDLDPKALMTLTCRRQRQ